MSKVRAIDLQLIKPVAGKSNLKGKIPLKTLLKELLTEINVPFEDPCCIINKAPLGYPVRFESGLLEYLDGNTNTWIEIPTGGGGGGIQSIVEGANINIDNTDPLNPVISAVIGDVDTSLFSEDKVLAANRTHDLAGHEFAMTGGEFLQLGANLIRISSKNEGNMAQFDWVNKAITIGDLGNWAGGFTATIDIVAKTLDITGGTAAFSCRGIVGIDGTFNADGQTVTVTGGIITAISAP